jgi:peptidyl-tRNA hydrolase, PTH1 family
MKAILLVGLGNPGKEYEKTRHNAGFMFVDYYFEKYRDEFGFSDWKFSKKLNAEISVGKIRKEKIILLKPQTFMNLSGRAVAAAVKYYKVKPEDLLVAHDEIDLPLGNYKISKNSSSAGHNGAQNIIDLLGTKNFTRLRIGIDKRGDKKILTEKYVLGKFTAAEMKIISKVLPLISNI